MARQKYTAGERAVAVIGALAGKSLEEINAQLRADRGRDGGELKELNAESYKMLLRKYAPHIEDGNPANPRWKRAWDHITAPTSMGEL
jgi:hypothetical protein